MISKDYRNSPQMSHSAGLFSQGGKSLEDICGFLHVIKDRPRRRQAALSRAQAIARALCLPASSDRPGQALRAIDRMNGCINLVTEDRMHDFLIGLAYVGIAFGPAVLASVRMLVNEEGA